MRRCPNCGFYNFTIAETCGRCETPFTAAPHKAAEAAVVAPAQPTPPPKAEKNPAPSVYDRLNAIAAELKALPPLPPAEDGDIQNELPPEEAKIAKEAPEEADFQSIEPQISAAGEILTLTPKTQPKGNKEPLPTVKLPSSLRRLTATLIDGLLMIMAFAVTILFTIPGEALFGDSVSKFYGIDKAIDLFIHSQNEFLTALMITAALAVLYNWLAVTVFGKTIGHKLLGLKVVRSDAAGRVGPGRALVRAIGLVGGMFCAGIGLYWRVFDSLRRDFGDLFAGSMVIKNI